MTDQLNNLSIKEKIVIFNYVNDELQIKRVDGKLYIYDGLIDSLLMEIDSNYINKYYSQLLKNSDKKIIKNILANYKNLTKSNTIKSRC